MSTAVRVRFAPSPTGHLHVGSVRVAIFNWLFARHHKGSFLVRYEDTDRARSTKEFLDSQIASLNWMGLVPDEEPVFQMSRIKEHTKAVDSLIAQGKAYRCFCEPKDHESADSYGKYDGTCRDKKPKEDPSKPHAVRFKLPDRAGKIAFNDLIRGQISIDYDQLDDFIIMRRDGVPVYNLVVVLDDIFMNITHVIRGEDHISNTPKQLLLYEALSSNPPEFGHLPLILGPSGARLSKRDAATSVQEYVEEGFLPDALFNYLVRLGWSHGDQEVFSRDELVTLFTLDAVQKKGAIFDKLKLLWLNGIYLRGLSPDMVLDGLRGISGGQLHEKVHQLWDFSALMTLVAEYKERSKTLVELAQAIIALAQDAPELDISLIQKWHDEKSAAVFACFCDRAGQLDAWDHDHLLSIAKQVCDEYETKLVRLAQPLRLALTGTITSPGVFSILEILGKTRSLERLIRLKPRL